jgi:ArsR family transcriptional regulator
MDTALLLKALGDPTRFMIFQQILSRKHCVRSLSKKLGISESAISQHMKVLREAGLVYGERFGYHIHYLPSQDALDYLTREITKMKEQSLLLCRDPGVCNCEFREKENLS